MRLVVTGRTGQVATALLARAPAGVEIVPIGRPELDLARPETIEPAIAASAPDVIVSAAAYTAVDRAESEPELAMAINGVAPGLIGRAAQKLGVPVLHLSTDYVFAGDKSAPYEESDGTDPRTAYGRSKLAGERAIAAATGDCAVLRTAWVYSPYGRNFLKTMLRRASDRAEVRVVADQRGNPTSALDVADALIAMAAAMLSRRDDSTLRGVFHLVGQGEASWAEFAAAIFESAAELRGPHAAVVPLRTADYPTPARRPANSRLSTAKLRAAFGLTLPDWRLSTREAVRTVLFLTEGRFS
ncbi:MAG: dTDP-4-dehydrorhamnose reductase [Devosia sp.]